VIVNKSLKSFLFKISFLSIFQFIFSTSFKTLFGNSNLAQFTAAIFAIFIHISSLFQIFSSIIILLLSSKLIFKTSHNSKKNKELFFIIFK
jgi:hypothetical protein